MSKIDQPKSPDSDIWQEALRQSQREVLTFDRAQVRKALRDAREKHTVKARVVLP